MNIATAQPIQWNGFLDFFLNHPTFFSTLLAAGVAVIGFILARKTSREKNSLDFEARYKDSDKIQKAWSVVREQTNTDQSFIAVMKVRKDAMLLLNEWERVANGIIHKVYDENLLYNAHGGTVILLFNRTRRYIESRQAKNPRVYILFTKLALDWKLRRAYEDHKGSKQNLTIILQAVYGTLNKREVLFNKIKHELTPEKRRVLTYSRSKLGAALNDCSEKIDKIIKK